MINEENVGNNKKPVSYLSFYAFVTIIIQHFILWDLFPYWSEVFYRDLSEMIACVFYSLLEYNYIINKNVYNFSSEVYNIYEFYLKSNNSVC